MPRLTPLSCKKIEAKLVKLGFSLDYMDGNICYYVKNAINGEELVVQVHRHPVERGVPVIQNILRVGKITREEWINA